MLEIADHTRLLIGSRPEVDVSRGSGSTLCVSPAAATVIVPRSVVMGCVLIAR
jgi:hypothetical protein